MRDVDALERLQPHVSPDEQMLWSGAPDPRVVFTAYDLFLVPFSILWGGFAMVWETVALTDGPVIMKLWGIPFVLVGLYMMVGRFFYKRYAKRRTAYGVTSQRALIVSPRSFTDMPLRNQSVSVQRSRDGRHATVTIGGPPPIRGIFGANRRAQSRMYANTGMDLLSRRGDYAFAFYDVPAPEAMLAALDQVRLGTTST